MAEEISPPFVFTIKVPSLAFLVLATFRISLSLSFAMTSHQLGIFITSHSVFVFIGNSLISPFGTELQFVQCYIDEFFLTAFERP